MLSVLFLTIFHHTNFVQNLCVIFKKPVCEWITQGAFGYLTPVSCYVWIKSHHWGASAAALIGCTFDSVIIIMHSE